MQFYQWCSQYLSPRTASLIFATYTMMHDVLSTLWRTHIHNHKKNNKIIYRYKSSCMGSYDGREKGSFGQKCAFISQRAAFKSHWAPYGCFQRKCDRCHILERGCWFFSGCGLHGSSLTIGDPLLERLVHRRHSLTTPCGLGNFEQGLKSGGRKARMYPPCWKRE